MLQYYYYTVSLKKKYTKLMAITLSILNEFSKILSLLESQVNFQ